MGLFDIFKDKDEDEDSGGMAEETPSFESEPEPTVESRDETPTTEPAEETTSYSQPLKKQRRIHKPELRYKVSLE